MKMEKKSPRKKTDEEDTQFRGSPKSQKQRKQRKISRKFCACRGTKTIFNLTRDGGHVCSDCGKKYGGDSKVSPPQKKSRRAKVLNSLINLIKHGEFECPP